MTAAAGQIALWWSNGLAAAGPMWRRFTAAVSWETRAAWQDARSHPVGAGATLLTVAVVVTAVASAVDDLSTTGWGDATTWFVVVPIAGRSVEVLLAMACWLGPAVLVGAAGSWLGAVVLVRWVRRSERVFVARRRRRWLFGLWLLLLTGVVVLIGGVTVGRAAVGTMLLVVGLTATARPRNRARTCRWLLSTLAMPSVKSARTPKDLGWRIDDTSWRSTRLAAARVWYPAEVKAYEPTARERIERAVAWALRDEGDFSIEWEEARRSFRVVEAPDPLPQQLDDRRWPSELPGVVLGVTSPTAATAQVLYPAEMHPEDGGQPLPLLTWDPAAERDILIAGVKGTGKSVLTRGVVVRSLASGRVTKWWIIDGKSSADYASLEGRDGIIAVAYKPPDWERVLREVIDEMERRYELARLYEQGRGPKPNFPRIGLLIDELQAVRDALGDLFDKLMSALARLARAARITLLGATQRPDVGEALPGAARDQFDDRVVCGWMSETGARMMLGPDWRYVTGDPNAPPQEWPRGRAVARIGGRLYRMQIPRLNSPVDDPAAEKLYPARVPVTVPAGTAPPPATESPAAPTEGDTPSAPVPQLRRRRTT